MSNEKTGKVRVLVVDDSAVMRKLVPGLLEADGEIEVVATAIDGDFALNKVEMLKPDVVTLDVDMPRMDGLTALSHLVKKYGVPVVMLSSLTPKGAELTIRALELGAVDFVCKPGKRAAVGQMGEELRAKVRAAASSRVLPGASRPRAVKGPARSERLFHGEIDLLAIGASSGGPHALRQMLPNLPREFAAGIVLVQHMPERFTAMLARWLDEICELEVREARDGDRVGGGRVLIAPGNAHMRVRRSAGGLAVELEQGQPVNGHMPSVDVLFESVAKTCGARACAVIMTGMGSDGANGIGQVREAGGHTVAQDRESCSIFGMPKVAIERGHIEKVVSLSEMASYLRAVAGGRMERGGRKHAENR